MIRHPVVEATPYLTPPPQGGRGPDGGMVRGINSILPKLAPAIVFALALLALAPTTGDIGLTWDEPSYRYSQQLSAQWWGRLFSHPTADLFDANTLLYYWPYGRFGINFHPPLAGQLNLLTYELFGNILKDIPARRMASVIEFALTITILYQFLARRYRPWVGVVAALSLLLMPRLYGDAHIAGTDTPGLLLWAMTAVAFWKGLHEPKARWWRVAVGVLLGLAFVEKMGAVMVAGPLVIWMAFRLVSKRRTKADWIDGLVTSLAMLVPLGLAYREVVRLSEAFFRIQRAGGLSEAETSVARTNLFSDHPPAHLPDWILLVPLAVWIIRRVAGRAFRKSPVWGVERPGLETWTAMLTFAPVVSWLGNPAWWREALPRLAHYYAISTGRRGALPDIQVLYFGQTYEYSLPWHNAWVLIAITVPVGILLASIVGLILRLPTIRRDRVPLYFFLHLLILPVIRMAPTPAHDGVRLFLPTFFFLAAFAGWGVVGLADRIGKSARGRIVVSSAIAGLVLVPAAWGLIKIHPFELSYYNEVIGGPRGAWSRGFELSYWYEAFDGQTLADLNQVLPDGAAFDGLNEKTQPPTFACLQELGHLKGTVELGSPDPRHFPFMWILTHDSKATARTRLAFAMTPFYERRPRQLDGLRVVTVIDPKTVACAWALQILADVGLGDPPRPTPPSAPDWVRSVAPPFGRFWGDGVTRSGTLRLNEPVFAWAASNPASFRLAALTLADHRPIEPGSDAERLRTLLTRSETREWRFLLDTLLRIDPKALLDAVEILIARPDDVRTVLLRYPYTDPSAIGGPLDRNLPRGKD